MNTVLSLLVLVLISYIVNSSEQTCSKDAKEKDAQCGTYCLQVVKPLLNYASSVRSKEEQFAELEGKIREQKAQLANQIELTAAYKSNIASKDALIANLQSQIDEKDKQINFLQSQLKNNELNINKKELEKEFQLNQKIESCKSNIESKDALIANLQSQVKSKDSQIDEKDKQINNLKKDYELNVVKTNQLESSKDTCISSSCLGKSTDLHTIKVPDIEPFLVPCDSQLGGGGWIVIQRRMDGSVDFNRTWKEYKEGFGDLRGEFFLGLEKLHLLTQSQPHELYVYMKDIKNVASYAKYSHFVIGNEEEAYALKKLGSFSGDAGNALVHDLQMKFSTKDRDNDKWKTVDCATNEESGWWFQDCKFVNLNGRYTTKNIGLHGKRIFWGIWHVAPLKFTQMMIRPKFT